MSRILVAFSALLFATPAVHAKSERWPELPELVGWADTVLLGTAVSAKITRGGQDTDGSELRVTEVLEGKAGAKVHFPGHCVDGLDGKPHIVFLVETREGLCQVSRSGASLHQADEVRKLVSMKTNPRKF